MDVLSFVCRNTHYYSTVAPPCSIHLLSTILKQANKQQRPCMYANSNINQSNDDAIKILLGCLGKIKF